MTAFPIATIDAPRLHLGSAVPTAPDELPTTWLPSRRARSAEVIAQAVLTEAVRADRLCALVAELRHTLGVDHAQVSIISDRQIALVVDGRLADAADLHDDATSSESDSPVVTSLENTLCVIAMRSDSQISIADTQADDRAASTAPVASGAIGSYLGSPIRTTASEPARGSDETVTIGVLCLYQARPHDWTYDEGIALDLAAEAVGHELQLIRDAVAALPSTDPDGIQA